jgi:hypothetical protein
LQQVFASIPYKTWSTTAPVDAAKVAAEFQGTRKPTPGSGYARGLVRLCRENPPDVAPPTPTLAEVWRRDGVFVRVLSNFHGDLRQAARAARFSWMAIQLDHTPYQGANEQELAQIGATLRGQGWTLVGWGTAGQGSDPAEDARRQAATVRRLGLKGWIANLELWAESVDIWKSGAYLRAWNESDPPCPLAVSCMSSTTNQWAREFDYPSWLAQGGVAVMPQVYGATLAAYTVDNCVATMRLGNVPDDRMALTFDVKAGTGTGPFTDYLTWTGPRSVYTGDDSTAATWKGLAR